MKIISSEQELGNEFLRLQNYYNEYYWAIAWAGTGFISYEYLKNNKNKIKEIIVGLHFYQTHPDFIKEYILEKSVKYIIQTDGTFHPKVYLFQNSNYEWEIIIGSPNFTNAAFTRNNEISVLISSKDKGSESIYSETKDYINKYWNEGEYFNEKRLIEYRSRWNIHRSKIGSLSGNYGNKRKQNRINTIFEINIQNLSWEEFVRKVISEQAYFVNHRIKVIKIANMLFDEKDNFKKMEIDERKFIAGIPNELNKNIDGAEHWAFFGSMKGAGTFKQKIIENNENISFALDEIPLSGQITKQHYLNFWKYYSELFSETHIATATRLLCMKRPDIFICFDSKNKNKLCEEFGIKKNVIDKDYYWDEIIERIFDCNWWQNPKPNTNDELIISDARAAFLDSLFYEK